MILGRNLEQDKTTCRVQNDNSGFPNFAVISLCFVWNRFSVHSVTRIPFGIFLMVLGRNVEQDEATCRVQE